MSNFLQEMGKTVKILYHSFNKVCDDFEKADKDISEKMDKVIKV